MIYRFYITYGSTEVEVFPLNFLETSLDDSREGNDIFYRRKFTGALTFTNNNGGNDFDLFWMIQQTDPCGNIYLRIERNNEVYDERVFSTNDGSFDLDRCTFSVVPGSNDDYRLLIDRSTVQHNILDVTPVVTTIAIKGSISETYTRNRLLNDVLEWLATDATVGISPGSNYSSEFFTLDTNYVTLASNKLKYLTIAQKSDIVRPTSTNPATTAMLSWEELMNILWVMFQVVWHYDSDTDTIHVEHISWYDNDPGLDLRTQILARSTNKFSYNKDEMPKYEKFSFMEADNVNFVGVPIWYDSSCVNQDPKTNVLEKSINVTTDLEYIINNPDSISDEGFVILCNIYSGGNYYVETTIGAYVDEIKLNMRLSWANLHNAYYRHNRVLIEGYMNETLTTFWTAQRNILQECFAIVCPSDNYDPNDYITTELGETWFGGVKAYVKSSQLKPSGEMKFNLVYGVPENENTGVDDDLFVVSGYVTFPGKSDYVLRFYFNQPAPGDINIRVRDHVYDSLGALRCTGSWYDITFASGTLSKIDGDNLCVALNAGDCVKMEIEYDNADIDGIEMDADDDSCETAYIYTVI